MPLNGTKVHPLKRPTKDAMCRLSSGKVRPTQEFNAGVVDRIVSGGLGEIVTRPSPYANGAGKTIPHIRLTDEGQRLVTAGFP